jgi:hypothetical protein
MQAAVDTCYQRGDGRCSDTWVRPDSATIHQKVPPMLLKEGMHVCIAAGGVQLDVVCSCIRLDLMRPGPIE